MSEGTSTDLLYPLTPLEVAAGRVLEPDRRLLGRPRSPEDPRVALEAVIAAELASGRASVSFSGGRDSSLILAVAGHVARKEGLPPPVAVTLRHSSPESDESQWQELVINHLGIQDWIKVEVVDSMDVLGPAPAGLLREHGPLWPANAYLHLPMVEACPPGTLLTGAGGDEILSPYDGRLTQVLFGSPRPTPRVRDTLALMLAASPRTVRAWWKRRAPLEELAWLRPEAMEELRARVGREESQTRARWDVMASRYAGSRSVRLGQDALGIVGGSRNSPVVSPLLTQRFVDAFATRTGPGGPPSRTASMRLLAEDLLPEAILDRRTKAVFTALVWGPSFRDFVASWDPSTMPQDLASFVYADLLQAEWESPEPHFASMLLLQAIWLAQA